MARYYSRVYFDLELHEELLLEHNTHKSKSNATVPCHFMLTILTIDVVSSSMSNTKH